HRLLQGVERQGAQHLFVSEDQHVHRLNTALSSARSSGLSGDSSASRSGDRCSGRAGPSTSWVTRSSDSSQASATAAIVRPRVLAKVSSASSASKVWSATSARYGSGRWVM